MATANIVPRAHGKVSGRRLRKRIDTATMYPARMRFHSKREPSSADHSDSTLKKVGVARLEFSATYFKVKSLERIAASMAPFAASTSANRESAHVRALSTSTAFRLRAPTNEATQPYSATASARPRANVPMVAVIYEAEREARPPYTGPSEAATEPAVPKIASRGQEEEEADVLPERAQAAESDPGRKGHTLRDTAIHDSPPSSPRSTDA